MSPTIPRVDFYRINDNNASSVKEVACRLLEKAYQNGHQILVYCSTRLEAMALDDQLWTYKANRFIPHALIWETLTSTPPIQIGYEYTTESPHDLILNLAATVPFFSPSLRRIIEIVPPADAAKTISRDHYRIYRAQHCELHTHEL